LCAVLLNVVYLVLFGYFFQASLENARQRGFLVKYGA